MLRLDLNYGAVNAFLLPGAGGKSPPDTAV